MYDPEKAPHLVVPTPVTRKHGIFITGSVLDGDKVIAETHGWFSYKRVAQRTKALAGSLAYWEYPGHPVQPMNHLK